MASSVSLTDLPSFVDQRPLVLFRIWVTDGGYFEIKHPNLRYVTRRTVFVCKFEEVDDYTPTVGEWVDPQHVTRVERLES